MSISLKCGHNIDFFSYEKVAKAKIEPSLQ